MFRPLRFLTSFCLALCAVLAGCAGTPPNRYSGLDSSAQLRPNAGDDKDRVPYAYAAPAADWRSYSSMIIEPVAIYTGADQQFEDISEADKQTLAACMQSEFEEKLGGRFILVAKPRPGTLRVKLTLTGAKTSTRFLSTFSRFDLGGGPYNLVQAARGKEGAFTGSVSYAVEIRDATSNTLLRSFISRQYPSPMNISATMGALEASKAGVRKGAEALAAELR
jgi:hypothetical protein